MRPLEGVKILDLTSMVSGPMAAMILADQGAEVIKVEPLHGEQMRHIGAPHNGVAAAFYSCNRGKKSLAIDLKSDEGKEILLQLAQKTDVFMQNFRPGAIERMGFGEEVLRATNKKLIYLSISGFGNNGPYAQARVYDPVIQALSGATDIQADRQSGRPQMFRIIIADKVTSLTAAQGVTAALYAREKSGEGQHIRLSMLDAMLAFFWPEGMAGLTYAENEFDVTLLQGKMDLIYKAKDRYITAGAVSDAEWGGMCRALGREDLLQDARFKTATDRFVNAEERKTLTAAEIEKHDSEDLLARFQEEGVPCAPLLTRMELMQHAQVLANESIDKTAYDGFGEVRQARPAAQFDKTPSAIGGPAPKLGQHSRAILAELGMDKAAQDALIAAGKIVVSDA